MKKNFHFFQSLDMVLVAIQGWVGWKCYIMNYIIYPYLHSNNLVGQDNHNR